MEHPATAPPSVVFDADGQTDMASSTLIGVLIKYIYTLWGRNRVLLPVIYIFPNTGCRAVQVGVQHFDGKLLSRTAEGLPCGDAKL